MKCWMLIFAILPSFIVAQSESQKIADSLKFVKDMPYICETLPYETGCGDKFFWNVVKQKQDIIPYLIEKLTDTFDTGVPVPYFGGPWTVADIAYAAMGEIIWDVPTFALLGVEFDQKGCGYCAYWLHLADFKNRVAFQNKVRKWYGDNVKNLVWVKSDKFGMCDCGGKKHPNGGHFEWKK